MKINPRIKLLLKFSISIALGLYFAFTISWKEVGTSLTTARLDLILGGYLFTLGILLFQAWRWKSLLQIPGLPLIKYLHFIFVGVFYRLILPGSISSDLLKVLLFGRKYEMPIHKSGMIFLSQFLGLAIQWIGGILGIFYFGKPLLGIFQNAELSGKKILTMALVGIALVGVLPFIPTFRRFVKDLLTSMKKALATPGVLSQVFFLTLGIQILMIGSAYCIFYSVGVQVPFFFLCFLMALVNSFLVLPISINGIGVVEYLNIFFIHNMLGYPNHQIIAVSAVSYSLLVFNALIGGIWILWRNTTDARALKSAGTDAPA